MASRNGGLVGRLLEAAGVEVVPAGEPDALRNQLTEAAQDRRLADLLAYRVLNEWGGGDQEDSNPRDRLALVAQLRTVYRRDPQARAAVRMLNDFVFGRGVPSPRCQDKDVQDVVDEAWDDPQNQRILTSYDAQRRKGIDLAVQANLLLLLFEGKDGRVKLGMLRHDDVKAAVRDPENRHRVLRYMTKERAYRWDYTEDRVKSEDDSQAKPRTVYYDHWSNVEEAQAEGVKVDPVPPDKRGDGRVYHVALNCDSEAVFGLPDLEPVVRWFSAYNEFMASRVDITKAAAQFIMKRRVQGGQTQVERLAQQQISRSGELASSVDAPDARMPARPGSTITENAGVVHEPFSLPTNSAAAQADGQMLRSQVSAGTGFPPHYFGDGDSSSLATATAMELPVLKMVEARQEVFEGVYRWFIDRVIERAVETGRLSRNGGSSLTEADGGDGSGERDLSYEFSFPNPLKRALTDIVSAVAQTAQVFDPNGTNLELSRTLLLIAFVALEVDDAPEAVKQIFPDNYVDPALAAYQEQQAQAQQAPPPPGGDQGQQPPEQQGATGADGKQHQAGNPYGAKQKATPPEKVQEALIARVDALDAALAASLGEREARGRDDGADAEARRVSEEFDREVALVALAQLEPEEGSNGNGSH
jgi:hypothetical protein